ncbi:threonine synthase [Candidatus Woesebacteria bacterium]|nr:threonine synthase [Candidatus Woesebacteria bacterium]
MRCKSTRGKSPEVSFEEAIFQGLAPDGGLYVPTEFPQIAAQSTQQSLQETAFDTLSPFLHEELSEAVLRNIITKELSFPIPLVPITPTTYILELFHGPTRAFKDIAAQILPILMEEFLTKKKRKLTILTATSGDTGGAVAHGFASQMNISVIILFPRGKVSRMQRHQLTHVAPNIYPIEVDGSFDDCQAIVKKAFSDPDFDEKHLTSANSINIGRLLPQMVYYAYATALLQNTEMKLRFVVPSGNMGNITAGLYAKKCGIPIDSFLLATNANDPVVTYFETGTYHPKDSIETLSTAMDIGNPSNFERMKHLFGDNLTSMKQDIAAVSVSDRETIEAIKSVYSKYHYLLDPHTAVGWHAAQKNPSSALDIIIATAHPSKFATEIYEATGIKSEELSFTSEWGERIFPIGPNYLEAKKLILSLL